MPGGGSQAIILDAVTTGTSYKGVANNGSAAIEVAVEKMNKDQK
jgi:hypothetical protein